MNLENYLDFLRRLITLIPFNVFDAMIFVAFLIYVFEDASFGILPAGISLVSTLSAFMIGLIFYHPVSEMIVDIFSLPKGISDAVAFLIVTGGSFVIISTVLTIIRRRYILLTFPKKIDMVGGALLGALSFFFIASFAVALLLSFPIAEVIKDNIRNSVSGRFLFSNTQGLESRVRTVFGGAIDDTINFLTIKPNSGQSVDLNFKTENYSIDEESEGDMLVLINEQRERMGLPSLDSDEQAQRVAREHARDMLERGYFSHYTPEGLSPFDRIDMANVAYQHAGENLAFAPDEEIAMNGLMKSEGHRNNILSQDFNQVGIAALDAGIFGKMYVQIFRD